MQRRLFLDVVFPELHDKTEGVGEKERDDNETLLTVRPSSSCLPAKIKRWNQGLEKIDSTIDKTDACLLIFLEERG